MAITMNGKCGNTWMNIVKGQYQDAFIEPEPDIADQFIKAKEITQVLVKAGMNKATICDLFVKGGYDMDVAEASYKAVSLSETLLEPYLLMLMIEHISGTWQIW